MSIKTALFCQSLFSQFSRSVYSVSLCYVQSKHLYDAENCLTELISCTGERERTLSMSISFIEIKYLIELSDFLND